MKARMLLPLAAGAVFALGLGLGGMTNPQRVIGFLDISGSWDPSLALVMGGALVVYATLMRLVIRRDEPLFDSRFHLPTRRDIDLRLVGGAALFGVGWGLGGYCPGPGITALASGSSEAVVFVLTMTAGMLFHRFMRSRSSRRPGAELDVSLGPATGER